MDYQKRGGGIGRYLQQYAYFRHTPINGINDYDYQIDLNLEEQIIALINIRSQES